MKIKNFGTIISIQQKKIVRNNEEDKIEKSIRIRLNLNVKTEEKEEYNIYVDNNQIDKNETKKAFLIPMTWDIKVANNFELHLNQKYDFVLADIENEDTIHVIGLTECSEK